VGHVNHARSDQSWRAHIRAMGVCVNLTSSLIRAVQYGPFVMRPDRCEVTGALQMLTGRLRLPSIVVIDRRRSLIVASSSLC
jgi:hypothetical protein